MDKKKFIAFLDFDNTITSHDVLDDMLERFSVDSKWMEFEKRWKKGEIGSRECLKRQVSGIRVTRKTLDDYLEGIKIDPYFKKALSFFASKNIKVFVLSDNFDYILKRILKKHGIRKLKTYSNTMTLSGGRLKVRFPLTNPRHDSCGHCKKNTLLKLTDDDTISIYVGDGISDVCASRVANIVFAKDSLLNHLKKEGLNPLPFKNFKDVVETLKRRHIG